MTAPLRLEALVDEAERPALVAGAEQLSESLGEAAGGPPWPVRLGFHSPGGEIASASAPTAIIASLLPEVARSEEPIGETEARWRAHLGRLQEANAPVFICTVFRHLPDRPRGGGVSPALERIRRLNRMSLTLSQDLGVAVIDIDRLFAFAGARVLKTDYRLGGVLAGEVAGHAVAWTLLSVGLDEAIDPVVQERAKAILGGPRELNRWINRRLARRRSAG